MTTRNDATIGLAIAVLFIGAAVGCEMPAPTPREPQTHTARAQVPQVAVMEESERRQRKGDVTIGITPVNYNLREGERVRVSEARRPLIVPDRYQNHVYVERRTETTLQVEPERLEFLLTLTNHGPRVLRTRGAMMELNVDGRALALQESYYRELVDAVVPPDGSREVRVFGPNIDEISDGGTIVLNLYDVPTARDDAGNVTERQNYQWAFEYSLDHVEREFEVQVDQGWMSPMEFHALRQRQR